MKMLRALFLTLPLLALGGCATMQSHAPLPETNDMPGIAFEARKGQAGGVMVPDAAWSLTSDIRAFRAGDVLTVVLQESTQASKQSGTSFGKNSNVSAKAGKLANYALPIDTDLGLKRDFNGSGSSSQQNALRGSVSVIVQRVLPNGLLEVRGEKRLTLNQGEEIVRLAGYVRTADIDTNNRVSSQQIANARIQYSGRGSLADANQPGWLTRLFNSSWMPM
jgi:flagellar L-ring protein FlgH